MAELTQEEVRHVAYLARIGVTDEDVARYKRDLSRVLAHFEALAAVDTEGVEPIGHITGMTNVLRADVSAPASAEEKRRIMDNVPETEAGYIKVKSVF